MVGAIEPAAPEPIEIHSRGIFHGAEEIGRRRTLELPAVGILTERVVEQLATHYRLTQHRQSGRGLGVTVGTELHHRL